MHILSEKATQEVMAKYNIKSLQQFPEISRFDPQALALAMRPGQVAKIVRKSITALETEYYRACI
jgi:DNA-directed RNA polymerase subunit H (RpoH/RPB5)